MMKPNLCVSIGSLKLRNPVLVASGTFGYGKEYSGVVDFSRLGGIITKTLTLFPKEGNPPPRIVETPSGMLNSIGLENVGLERFIKEKIPFLRKVDTKVIVNIAGRNVSEFGVIAERLSYVSGIDALELNLSCPNVAGGMDFSREGNLTMRVVREVKRRTKLPVLAKLSPNVTSIEVIAKAAEDGGSDGISLINTLVGMAIDIRSWRSKLGTLTGGLSGPAIKPVALAHVYKASKAIRIPVIGIGGILDASDAIEFFLAGATAVQVGTANFLDPKAAMKVVFGLEKFCREKKIRSIHEIIGKL